MPVGWLIHRPGTLRATACASITFRVKNAAGMRGYDADVRRDPSLYSSRSEVSNIYLKYKIHYVRTRQVTCERF